MSWAASGECGQQVKDRIPPVSAVVRPQLEPCTAQYSSLLLQYSTGSPVQERWPHWRELSEGHKNDEGTGAPLLGQKTEGAGWFSPESGITHTGKRTTRGRIQALPSSGQCQDQRVWTHTGTQESPYEDQEAFFLYEASQESGDAQGSQLWMALLVHGGLY